MLYQSRIEGIRQQREGHCLGSSRFTPSKAQPRPRWNDHGYSATYLYVRHPAHIVASLGLTLSLQSGLGRQKKGTQHCSQLDFK